MRVDIWRAKPVFCLERQVLPPAGQAREGVGLYARGDLAGKLLRLGIERLRGVVVKAAAVA